MSLNSSTWGSGRWIQGVQINPQKLSSYTASKKDKFSEGYLFFKSINKLISKIKSIYSNKIWIKA